MTSPGRRPTLSLPSIKQEGAYQRPEILAFPVPLAEKRIQSDRGAFGAQLVPPVHRTHVFVEKSDFRFLGLGEGTGLLPLCGQTHHVKGQIGWTPSFPIADDNVDSGGLDPIGVGQGLELKRKTGQADGIQLRFQFTWIDPFESKKTKGMSGTNPVLELAHLSPQSGHRVTGNGIQGRNIG